MKRLKSIINVILVIIPFIVVILYFKDDINGLLRKSDYTIGFNVQREKLKLPLLPNSWKPVFSNRKKYETQYWNNDVIDTINPIHSQKQVIVQNGNIYMEVDVYTNAKDKQKIEIEYYYKKPKDNWRFVLYDSKKLEKSSITEKQAVQILSLWKLNHPKINP
jgi:hypothetical protein